MKLSELRERGMGFWRATDQIPEQGAYGCEGCLILRYKGGRTVSEGTERKGGTSARPDTQRGCTWMRWVPARLILRFQGGRKVSEGSFGRCKCTTRYPKRLHLTWMRRMPDTPILVRQKNMKRNRKYRRCKCTNRYSKRLHMDEKGESQIMSCRKVK